MIAPDFKTSAIHTWVLREQEFTSFNRTGSQLGKQKTVKGTPDTFYRLPSGALGYVEYTTQADNVTEKIIKDIDSCLDEKKTGVPATDVNKITICFNSRLDTSEEATIIKYAQSKGVAIELIGIDILTIDIHSRHLILAKEFLGIPLDTGQVLPIGKFIEEYNSKAGELATPIDNIFLHRVKELKESESTLKNKNLLIIAGFPGVGKTKLGIEAIDRFCKANPSYQAYAIAKKDVDIFSDLRILLQSDKDYVVLVDDANRQLPNLLQILGMLGETRKGGTIKLILTVRNYAYQEVARLCDEYGYSSIEVNKFTDEEIREIISSDSFEIRHSRYQKKIIEISDGNARLAVMAARVARQQRQEFLLGDVSELYDVYFDRFLRDLNLTDDKTLLKTLAIVSFCFSIQRNDKEFITKVLELFGLDYYKFNEAIDELHKRELVEVQYDIVRISDQILATYVFYKVFIKDQILSYQLLLKNYFPKWMTRFKETIIPSNNSFGYENVLGKIDGVLNDYLISIYSDEEKVLEFFSLFWFYKPTEMLAYFHKQIKQLPEPQEPVYTADDSEVDKLGYGRNKTLEFLSNLFNHNVSNAKTALELAFEYCRKNPDDLPDLIKYIKDNFRFDEADEAHRYQKQFALFDLLRERFQKGEPHYIAAFFGLSKTFLARFYDITKGGRKHTIVFYDYPLSFDPAIREFRSIQWEFLKDSFDRYPKDILDVLGSFGPHHRELQSDEENKLLAYDLTFLIPLIELKLNPDNFHHIHFVHELVAGLDRVELPDRSYQKLKSTFYNKEYEDYLKIDWNQLRDKEVFEFDDYDQYVIEKANDLRYSFTFTNAAEFKRLHTAIANSLSIKENPYEVAQSLDIVIEGNFAKNNQLGFDLFCELLNSYPENISGLHKSIKSMCEVKEVSHKLLKVLRESKHPNRILWLFTYFECVPESSIDQAIVDELLTVFDEIDTDCHIWFERLEKYQAIDDRIIEKILEKVVKKIADKKLRIKLSHRFFEKYSSKIIHNFNLLSQAYLQQETIDNHTDLQRLGLKQLVLMEPKFLLTYLDKMYVQKDEVRRDERNRLGFVWDLPVSDSIIEEAFSVVVGGNAYYGVGDHPINIFFNALTDAQSEPAKKFVLKYIATYAHDAEKINAIFDAIRHRMKAFHEEAFLHFLTQNSDVEFFKEIWWRGNGGGMVSGDVNFGEVEKSDWMKILAMVEKFPNQVEVLEIKAFVKQQIVYAIQRAEDERQRRFANPDWPW